jgi:lysozyme
VIPQNKHQLSAQGVKLLKSFEGLRLAPYADVAGNQTVGYGHKILPAGNISGLTRLPGGRLIGTITQSTAEYLFSRDVGAVVVVVNDHVKAPLLQCQFDALVCLIFNIGTSAFLASTLLIKINSALTGHHGLRLLPVEFMRWCHTTDTVSPELTLRRIQESAVWLGWSPPSNP